VLSSSGKKRFSFAAKYFQSQINTIVCQSTKPPLISIITPVTSQPTGGSAGGAPSQRGLSRSARWSREDIARARHPSDWKRLSAGAGTKGPRLHDWCYLELADLEVKKAGSQLTVCGRVVC
jgi:hypothetical protein